MKKYLTDWRGLGLKTKEECTLHLRNKLLARSWLKRKRQREEEEKRNGQH